jgi:hypothetical protein
MKTSLAYYLPVGTEVVFYDDDTRVLKFGVICSYGGSETTLTYSTGSNMNLGVLHNIEPGSSSWSAIDCVTILKLNPTPKEKMLYMLKGTK